MDDPRREIPAAGRKRVEMAFARLGLLLISGQHEIPSVADLIAGEPVTTRGYSWDYVPAWRLAAEVAARPDVAEIKLFRGRSTLVHRQHWPAVEALARAAHRSVLAADGELRDMLVLIESRDGITGEAIKDGLGLAGKSGTRAFQRLKAALCERLCIVGDEQRGEETGHTHDLVWRPWRAGKIAKGVHAELPDPELALRDLAAAAGLGRFPQPSDVKSRKVLARLFPVARLG